MSNVDVPFEGKAAEKAVLLLDAAETLGLDASVVRTYPGGFSVPEEVEKKAFGKQDAPPPAKKAAAKKSTTKKAQE